jgi:hypothetical protein
VTGDRLEFAIHPLGVAGTPHGLAAGPPDDHDRIRTALADLGDLPARTYLVDMEPGGGDAALALADRYRRAGLLDHATLGCLRDDYDSAEWTELVRTVVARHGDRLRSLQITNEPNLSFMDGSKPYVLDALVEGVIAAKDEARRRGVHLDVGFGSVPCSDVTLPDFWDDLAEVGSAAFVEAVDFVGHNFYVDVFEPAVETAQIADRVGAVLGDLRSRDLRAAHIPSSVPIRVTENGWPTGTNPFTETTRTAEQQAINIDALVHAVHRSAADAHVTHYMLFGLRDADSSKSDLFHQFGIMRDDYTPKPAYDTFRSLIRALGRRPPPLTSAADRRRSRFPG